MKIKSLGKYFRILEHYYELQQNLFLGFYPRGTGHVSSNLLLSAGILSQYKTYHVSF